MKRLQYCIGSLAAAAAIAGCAGEEVVIQDEVGPDRVAELNAYLLELQDIAIPDVVVKTEVECEQECPEDAQEQEAFCTYTKYTETGHYNEFVAFQPNSAALWPGSVVQGIDALNGFFTPVGVDRAPLSFSLSLENINASPVGHLATPSLSAFRAERNRILDAGTSGATPASMDFEVTEVHSLSQISLALGASVKWPGGGSVTAGFDFTSSEQKTKILVNFVQAYYTIDVDTPIHPADFFGENVTLEELSNYMDSDNPPVYVQSITYGRRVIFSVESSESADLVKASLEAAYSAGVEIEGSLSAEYANVLEESSIRAFVLGGSGAEAAGAISGFQGLIQYITKGGDYSKESPGAPIAYKLAYLDNVVTKFAFTTEYAERTCVRNQGSLRVDLAGFDHIGGDDPGDELEVYGFVRVRYPTADSDVVDCRTGGAVMDVWNLSEGSWVNLPENASWTPSSAMYVQAERVPFDIDKKFCISTHIWEDDTWGDDDYGYFERLLSASDINGDHVMQARGSGDAGVDVRLSISLE